MPLFSVCIATVSDNKVAGAIASVVSQTVADWELIVVDQGESPAMRRIVLDAAEKDAASNKSATWRIHYLHLDTKGTCLARNAGVDNAAGDYIAFTDDDCEADPNWLASLYDSFQQVPDAGLVGGSLLTPHNPGRTLASCPSVNPGFAVYRPEK